MEKLNQKLKGENDGLLGDLEGQKRQLAARNDELNRLKPQLSNNEKKLGQL